MIERQQRRLANRLISSHERALRTYLANAGTWTRDEFYANAPSGMPPGFLSERLRAMIRSGNIIQTRDGKYRMMGCV